MRDLRLQSGGRGCPVRDLLSAATLRSLMARTRLFGGLSAPRVGPRAFVFRALTAARRPIPCGSARDRPRRSRASASRSRSSAARSRSRAATPASPDGALLSIRRSGIFTIFGGLCAIFGCNFAVIDGSHAAVRSISAASSRPGAFVTARWRLLLRGPPVVRSRSPAASRASARSRCSAATSRSRSQPGAAAAYSC